MTETAAAMGVTEEQLAALTESVKSLPLTLWIDADGYVLKYEMNLTEVMQKIMDKAMEAAGLTVEDKAEKVEIDGCVLCRKGGKNKHFHGLQPVQRS